MKRVPLRKDKGQRTLEDCFGLVCVCVICICISERREELVAACLFDESALYSRYTPH